MKCPNCEYEHGWSGDPMKSIEGAAGEFYALPIKAQREGSFYGPDDLHVFICPNCYRAFGSRFI